MCITVLMWKMLVFDALVSAILLQSYCSMSNVMILLADLNECISSPCHINATCINTNGSFNCVCNPGYTGNGFECDGRFGVRYFSQRNLY